MKTVILKTAKQLKANGFPQNSFFGWYKPMEVWKTGVYWRAFKGSFAAPTAEEVLEELPKHIGKNENYQPVLTISIFDEDKESDLHWKVAYVENDKEGSVIQFWDNSLAEAAGKCWLYFKKEGLL